MESPAKTQASAARQNANKAAQARQEAIESAQVKEQLYAAAKRSEAEAKRKGEEADRERWEHVLEAITLASNPEQVREEIGELERLAGLA